MKLNNYKEIGIIYAFVLVGFTLLLGTTGIAFGLIIILSTFPIYLIIKKYYGDTGFSVIIAGFISLFMVSSGAYYIGLVFKNLLYGFVAAILIIWLVAIYLQNKK